MVGWAGKWASWCLGRSKKQAKADEEEEGEDKQESLGSYPAPFEKRARQHICEIIEQGPGTRDRAYHPPRAQPCTKVLTPQQDNLQLFVIVFISTISSTMYFSQAKQVRFATARR